MNAAKDIFRALLQVQAQIKAELVEARERISAGAAFAARVNDSVFRVDDALTLTTSDIEGDIALLAVDATDQEERLDEHDEALDLNTGSIASLSDSVGSLASSLSAVSKRIESHIEDAVQHRARWSTTRDSVYTMRSALISLGGRLDRLERTAIKNPFVLE